MNKGDRQLPARTVDPAAELAGLAALARERLPPPEDARAAAGAFARFQLAGGERVESRRRARAVWAVSTGALALAAAGALLLPVLRRPAAVALTLRVEGGVLAEGGYVRAGAADSEPRLRFSDGTEVSLSRASRARVADTDGDGARVLLEDGRARAQVVARARSRWIFDAGPCRVRVTGTRFDMHWSAAHQVLEVALYQGSVTVEGPPAVAGVPMRAGQRLVMDVRGGTVRFGEIAGGDQGLGQDEEGTAPPAVTPTPTPADDRGARAAEPAEEPAEAKTAVERTPRAAAPLQRDDGWTGRVLAGEFRGVIREARRRGMEEVLRRESAGNLMALADAARYAGSARLAARALTQVRGRFPDSAPAHRAAFLLGRLAEDQDGDLARALDWYRIYLADADGDPGADAFRAEALGRQMTATLRLQGVARAQPLATAYLRRYPRGAYAKVARTIVAP